MANPNHDKPVESVIAEHMRLSKLSEKAKVPKGRQGVGGKELAEHWKTLGTEERKRIRMSMATPEDPDGVRAFLEKVGR